MIVSDIQTQTIMQETEFSSNFPRLDTFRFQVFIRISRTLINLSYAIEWTVCIQVVIGTVTINCRCITNFSPTTTQFQERKCRAVTFQPRQRFSSDPAQAGRRIEERLIDCWAPVITGTDIQIQLIFPSYRSIGIYRVWTNMAMIHTCNCISFLIGNGINTQYGQCCGSKFCIFPRYVSIVGTTHGGNIEISNCFVETGDQV